MKTKNKKVIEHFGSASEFGDDADSIIGKGMGKTSFMKTGFCAGIGQSLGRLTNKRKASRRRKYCT